MTILSTTQVKNWDASTRIGKQVAVGMYYVGIITALCAQGYPSKNAVLLEIYLHDSAGALVAKEISRESLMASDIIRFWGKVLL